MKRMKRKLTKCLLIFAVMLFCWGLSVSAEDPAKDIVRTLPVSYIDQQLDNPEVNEVTIRLLRSSSEKRVVPQSLLKKIKDSGKTLNINMMGAMDELYPYYYWIFNSNSGPETMEGDVNLDVSFDKSDEVNQKIEKIINDDKNAFVTFDFEQSGAFPYNESLAGYAIDLPLNNVLLSQSTDFAFPMYYYNESSNILEYVSDVWKDNGFVRVTNPLKGGRYVVCKKILIDTIHNELPVEYINKLISDSYSANINITCGGCWEKDQYVIPKTLLQNLKTSKKKLRITFAGIESSPTYTWTFDGSKIQNAVDVEPCILIGSSDKITSLIPENVENCIIEFKHNGTLPEGTSISIGIPYNSNMTGNAYLYYYNDSTKKFVPTGSCIIRDTDGGLLQATITGITHCSEYVITSKELPEELIEEPSVLPFIDVKEGDWYYSYVKYVFEKNIMTGITKEVFAPGDNLSRGQFATILHRMEASPKTSYNTRFSDVPDGEFYTVPVIWASSSEIGIIAGYKDGRFGPADNITREQMAVMMYRYAQYKGYSTDASVTLEGFIDSANVSEFAEKAMKWAVANEIISGNEDGTLAPQGNAGRAVCATIVQRFIKKFE